jgi:hypothetical protein
MTEKEISLVFNFVAFGLSVVSIVWHLWKKRKK